ncbi:hypothetical protein [Roseobacter sp. CCS2]|uniref:hypothetical protein n=1 Tax=Roseobacter sp. CCS2 TaxID=391593 RepID=UPI0000F40575|nr:hypothetical protein [Roseobacter sp. CCS2]EBA11499.1 hypothetical protein RCCS2_02533 [Roseobacter sp. CCS2]
MPFVWPTSEQIVYRVMRLRRLIAVAVAVPVVVMLGLALFDPAVLSPERATIASMAVALLVVGHVVLFPNVTLETISLSLSVTALVVAMPVIKIVAAWAPAPHQTAALVILVALAVAAMGVLMALLQIALNTLAYSGPVLRLRLKTRLDLPCSAMVARRQCALQPQTRRGRVLTGAADENGFFDVAVASHHVADPENPDQPLVVKVDAKVLNTTEQQHDVMIVLPNGSVTVTSQSFAPAPDGCRIEVTDMPGDFTTGMHALFWLTDQQADNLTEMSDIILGHDARANGLAHGISLLSVAGMILSPRPQVAKRAE